MSELVERVRGYLQKRQVEQALGALIDAWRATRAPALADAVDAIDALVPTSDALATRAWLAAAKSAKTHRERGTLLRTIARRPAADIAEAMAVASAWNDPRLSTRIIELLTAMPFSGKRTREVWRAVFEAAKAQQDPRFLAVANTLPQTWNVGADTKTFLSNRLKEATRGLVEPELPASTRDALVAFAAEVVPRVQAPANTTSLLDAIYEHPDDDTARAVYADWLQEQGDPRGEFIAMQLSPAERRDHKAEQALIKQHKKTWLGPLATVVTGEVEFRRGFPAKVTARFRHQRDAEQLGTVRAWATVEELDFNPSGSRDDQAAWTRFVSPAMSNLRLVKFPDPRWLSPVERPWRIEELWVDVRDKQGLHALCGLATLPALRTLVVRGAEPAFLDGIERMPPHLTVLDGYGLRDEKRRRAYFAAVAKLPIERFTILWYGAGELHHHFTRDAKKAFTRLEIEIRHDKHDEPTDYELREISGELRKLPAGFLTHLDARFVGGDGVARPIRDLQRLAKTIVEGRA